MNKQGLLMVILMLVAVMAWAKGKTVVWDNHTTRGCECTSAQLPRPSA